MLVKCCNWTHTYPYLYLLYRIQRIHSNKSWEVTDCGSGSGSLTVTRQLANELPWKTVRKLKTQRVKWHSDRVLWYVCYRVTQAQKVRHWGPLLLTTLTHLLLSSSSFFVSHTLSQIPYLLVTAYVHGSVCVRLFLRTCKKWSSLHVQNRNVHAEIRDKRRTEVMGGKDRKDNWSIWHKKSQTITDKNSMIVCLINGLICPKNVIQYVLKNE